MQFWFPGWFCFAQLSLLVHFFWVYMVLYLGVGLIGVYTFVVLCDAALGGSVGFLILLLIWFRNFGMILSLVSLMLPGGLLVLVGFGGFFYLWWLFVIRWEFWHGCWS